MASGLYRKTNLNVSSGWILFHYTGYMIMCSYALLPNCWTQKWSVLFIQIRKTVDGRYPLPENQGLFFKTLILVPDRSGSKNRKIASARLHTYLWSDSIYSMNDNIRIQHNTYHWVPENRTSPFFWAQLYHTAPWEDCTSICLETAHHRTSTVLW